VNWNSTRTRAFEKNFKVRPYFVNFMSGCVDAVDFPAVLDSKIHKNIPQSNPLRKETILSQDKTTELYPCDARLSVSVCLRAQESSEYDWTTQLPNGMVGSKLPSDLNICQMFLLLVHCPCPSPNPALHAVLNPILQE
jgi:hypothetical protein